MGYIAFMIHRLGQKFLNAARSGTILAGLLGSAMPSAHEAAAADMPMDDIFQRQYTFVSDTNHGDIRNLERFVDIVPSFIKSGGKHIVLEWGPVAEEFWQIYKSGKLDDRGAREFLEKTPYLASSYLPGKDQPRSNELFFQVMQLAKQNGLEIHAQDQEEIIAARDYPDIVQAVASVNRILQENGREQAGQWFGQKMAEPDFARRYGEFRAHQEDERTQADRKVADIVTSRVGTDKTLIFYGAEHDDNDNRLGTFLGKDKVTIVPLISSRDAPAQMQYIFGLSKEWQYFAHYVAEDQTYKMDSGKIGTCIASAKSGDIAPCGDEVRGLHLKPNL